MFAILVGLACVAAVRGGGPLNVAVDTTTGVYNVTVGGQPYFFGEQPTFQYNGEQLSPQSGNLKLTGSTQTAGGDGFGAYTGVSLSWAGFSATFTTAFRVYGSFIVFEQVFVSGSPNSSTPNDVLSEFPKFNLVPEAPEALGFLAYSGYMTGAYPLYGTLGSSPLPGGLDGSGPLVIFNKDLSTSFVLSSASNFFAHSQMFDASHNTLSYGVMGSVTSVPAQYSLETILYLGSGVNQAMTDWGSVLLARYGKDRSFADRDLTLRYIGYSTDNGAYYYYLTEQGKNYEQTMLDIATYAAQESIPYRWLLLDSWWYPKGPDGGVTTWLAEASVFPDGLDYVFNQTGWPIQGHNRYWSNETTYAKQNGGQYNFLIDNRNVPNGHLAVPDDQAFWDFLMSSSKRWGLEVYEQDWLNDATHWVSYLTTDAQLGRRWLLQMGKAADKNGIAIQYCMSLSRHIMQSLELPAVTQARASTDYHLSPDQWIISVSSIFAHAVGLAPTKDNYWSIDVQPGNPYKGNVTEPFTRLQAAISTISAGPVAPSDKIGYSDAALIMMSCMKDGRLLQPSRPATAIDATFLKRSGLGNGPDGELQSTYSLVSGGLYSTVLGAVLNSDYTLPIADLGYGPSDTVVVIEANTTSTYSLIHAGGALTVKACAKWDFQLYSVAPVLPNGWAVIGETVKWVPVNNARITSIAYSASSVTVTAAGVNGESLTLSFYNSASGTGVAVTCVFDEAATLVFTVPSATCWSA